jgi:hypothetical protein
MSNVFTILSFPTFFVFFVDYVSAGITVFLTMSTIIRNRFSTLQTRMGMLSRRPAGITVFLTMSTIIVDGFTTFLTDMDS